MMRGVGRILSDGILPRINRGDYNQYICALGWKARLQLLVFKRFTDEMLQSFFDKKRNSVIWI